MEPMDLPVLQREIERLLDAALRSDAAHLRELDRRDELHVRELARRDDVHVRELERREVLHDDETRRRSARSDEDQANLRRALETRDLIGQAKGVLIATLGVSAEQAFVLLSTQSQHENRKVVEIAAEVVERARRGGRGG